MKDFLWTFSSLFMAMAAGAALTLLLCYNDLDLAKSARNEAQTQVIDCAGKLIAEQGAVDRCIAIMQGFVEEYEDCESRLKTCVGVKQ